MDEFEDLVRVTRSHRRFDETVPVGDEVLRELVGLARLTASSTNRQPLKYALSSDPATNEVIFGHLLWAILLEGGGTPADGERPQAYIVVLGDTRIAKTFGCDHGIAAQTIMLGATERGLGGCIMGSIDRVGLAPALGIPEHLEILLVLALGKPADEVVLEQAGPDGDVDYWRDEAGVHHVPKRPLDELIVPIRPRG